MTPGRKPSITTSARSTNACATASSSGSFRSRAMLRLPRCSRACASVTQRGPLAGSARTTSAPWSARIMPTSEGARCWPKSTTRTPSSTRRESGTRRLPGGGERDLLPSVGGLDPYLQRVQLLLDAVVEHVAHRACHHRDVAVHPNAQVIVASRGAWAATKVLDHRGLVVRLPGDMGVRQVVTEDAADRIEITARDRVAALELSSDDLVGHGLMSVSLSGTRNAMPRRRKSPTTSANASGRSPWMSCAASCTIWNEQLLMCRRYVRPFSTGITPSNSPNSAKVRTPHDCMRSTSVSSYSGVETS